MRRGLRGLLIAAGVLMVSVAVANAEIINTWSLGDIAPGSNLENLLSVTSTPSDWTNSHVEITVTSGGPIVTAGTDVAYHYDALGITMEDTGCYPSSAAVAYHVESPTYYETDWGVTGGTSSVDPVYVVTLPETAMGTWLVRSWNLNGEDVTDSGPIVDGVLIPEPATMSLLVIGGLAAVIRKRR